MDESHDINHKVKDGWDKVCRCNMVALARLRRRPNRGPRFGGDVGGRRRGGRVVVVLVDIEDALTSNDLINVRENLHADDEGREEDIADPQRQRSLGDAVLADWAPTDEYE